MTADKPSTAAEAPRVFSVELKERLPRRRHPAGGCHVRMMRKRVPMKRFNGGPFCAARFWLSARSVAQPLGARAEGAALAAEYHFIFLDDSATAMGGLRTAGVADAEHRSPGAGRYSLTNFHVPQSVCSASRAALSHRQLAESCRHQRRLSPVSRMVSAMPSGFCRSAEKPRLCDRLFANAPRRRTAVSAHPPRLRRIRGIPYSNDMVPGDSAGGEDAKVSRQRISQT